MPATRKFTKPQINILAQVASGTHELVNAPDMGRFGRGGPEVFCINDQRARRLNPDTFAAFRAAGLIAHVPQTYRYAVTDAGRELIAS